MEWDSIANFSLTSVLGDRGSNVFRFGWIGELLSGGSRTFFTDDVDFIGLVDRDQFAIGSRQEHPSYVTGVGGGGGETRVRTWMWDDVFSYFAPDLGGDHNFKFGGGFSLNRIDPRASVDSGLFIFESDLPFNPANRATFPEQFEIQTGPAGQNPKQRAIAQAAILNSRSIAACRRSWFFHSSAMRLHTSGKLRAASGSAGTVGSVELIRGFD